MRVVILVATLTPGVLVADEPKRNDGPAAFQGTWTIVEMEKGKKGEQPVTARTVIFEGTRYAIKSGTDLVERGTFTADAAKTPNTIEVTVEEGMDKGKKWHGVYELEGDTLRAVVGPADKDRPKSLANPAPGTRGFTLKRAK